MAKPTRRPPPRRNPPRGIRLEPSPGTPAGGEEGEDEGKEKAIEMEGTITAVLAGTMFRVALPNKHEVLAHISGKMRKRFIRLVIGDRVKIEMSPYDKDKARIVYRLQ
jgi:translation initiation factor IF-1